jgi:MerR family transcriptional regulator, thiopeptide resistance regulator
MPQAGLKGMKVGEVAKATGVSVRTLHYYDEIGLLQPSTVTDSGHRVYGASELARLQQIKSMRQLGFSLGQIRACLDTPEYSPRGVIALHIERLREQIDRQERLVALLETLDRAFAASGAVSPEDFVRAIEAMTLVERAFTHDELAEIRQRGERLGRERVRAVEREWPVLISQVRAEMQAGTDAASERMRPLAARWRALVREFTGGSPSIEQKVRAAFVREPRRMTAAGLDPDLIAYVNRAIRALDS